MNRAEKGFMGLSREGFQLVIIIPSVVSKAGPQEPLFHLENSNHRKRQVQQ